MLPKVSWRVYLQVKSEDKAKRVLHEFVQNLPLELTVVACDRYWKDQTLFQASLTSALASENQATAVLETLRACSILAVNWLVGAPQEYAGGKWEFSGSAVRETIRQSSVVDIDFHASNFHEDKSLQSASESTLHSA